MTGFFSDIRDGIANELEKMRNRRYLDATMAASALVMTADGDVNITELNIIDQVLKFKGIERIMEEGFRPLLDERP